MTVLLCNCKMVCHRGQDWHYTSKRGMQQNTRCEALLNWLLEADLQKGGFIMFLEPGGTLLLPHQLTLTLIPQHFPVSREFSQRSFTQQEWMSTSIPHLGILFSVCQSCTSCGSFQSKMLSRWFDFRVEMLLKTRKKQKTCNQPPDWWISKLIFSLFLCFWSSVLWLGKGGRVG